MHRKFLPVSVVAAIVTGVIGYMAAAPSPVSAATGSGQASTAPVIPFSGTVQDVCPTAPAGYSSCLAERIQPQTEQSHVKGLPSFFRPAKGNSPAVTVSGLAPTTLDGVYGFTTSSTAGSGQTIAIVDAYDDPNAAADLSTFDTQFNLPACTTANGCFTKVNQTGGTTDPAANTGWGLEISLDVQWAHAIAPGAKILLVEANSNSDSDLYTAEQYAAAHANEVSNSWGGSEYLGENTSDSVFTSASGKVSFFAATGDTGSEVDYPATSPNVIAVGGTTLSFTGGGAFSSESAWADGGGGCSSYEGTPSFQSGLSPQRAQVGCSGRSVPDVSLDADPNSGVAVYDTGYSGWITVGGTSVATPIWAAQASISDAAGSQVTLQSIYSSSFPFRDITSGSNGHAATIGYDLATGRGSWATTTPAQVTGVTATGSSSGIALSWPAAARATSYAVLRGVTSGKESSTPITTVTGTTFTDTSAGAGSTYYYEIEPLDSAGPGSLSNEVSAAASSSGGSGGSTTPAQVTGLKATGSAGQVALSWSSASGAATYTVLRGTVSGQETTTVATGVTTTTYTDTQVSGGNTYYYKVEGVSSGGTVGPPSAEASAPVPSSGSGSGGSSHPNASFSKSCSFTVCTLTSKSTDSGGTITKYSWVGGNGLSSSSASVQHLYTAAGTWAVALTVTDNNNQTSTANGTVTCSNVRAGFFSVLSCQ